MTKELSIENIKRELLDKLMNNMDILNYLEVEKLLNEGYKISQLYNNVIFDYDVSNKVGDYISVEVAEYEYSHTKTNDSNKYIIEIKMGLNNESNLDNIASVIKNIVLKLYPNRKRFSNVPFYTKERGSDFFGDKRFYDKLNRMIRFEIE